MAEEWDADSYAQGLQHAAYTHRQGQLPEASMRKAVLMACALAELQVSLIVPPQHSCIGQGLIAMLLNDQQTAKQSVAVSRACSLWCSPDYRKRWLDMLPSALCASESWSAVGTA